MVLPVCGKRGQGGEINSKFAEECEPVSGLCSVCQNSVINAVASLTCHFHQPSPALPPLQMKQLWLSSDSENKTIFHCPPCPLSPPPQPHPITGRLETWLQLYFQTETMKNNLVEENIFLQLLWSVRLNVEWDCLWCPGSRQPGPVWRQPAERRPLWGYKHG